MNKDLKVHRMTALVESAREWDALVELFGKYGVSVDNLPFSKLCALMAELRELSGESTWEVPSVLRGDK